MGKRAKVCAFSQHCVNCFGMCFSINVDRENKFKAIQLVLLKIELLKLLIFRCFSACTWKQTLCGLTHAVSHCQRVLLPILSPPAALLVFLFFFFLPILCSCRSQSPSPLCFSQVRKFVSKDSAGLRVRSHPSLQSEQIGIVHVNGTITFIDEVIDSRPGRIML